jgi:hypothetical protein
MSRKRRKVMENRNSTESTLAVGNIDIKHKTTGRKKKIKTKDPKDTRNQLKGQLLLLMVTMEVGL